MVKQDIKSLKLGWKVRMDMDLILEMFSRRSAGEKISIPKAFEANFDKPVGDEERKIHKMISEYRLSEIADQESELFAQKTRLNKALDALKTKVTKTNEKERDVAGRKIETITKKLETLKNSKPRTSDSRIYAKSWAPVIVWENGERVVKPMRYLLRPSHMPESFDKDYPGCYNARRDNLSGFWKNQFGTKHGLIIVTSFFENVTLHDLEKRALKRDEKEKNVVIEFKPQDMDYMVVPCIWDTWVGKDGSTLDSFALITDEPPAEVLETGHDRCPIFLSESRVDDWLNPKGKSQKELFEILDDRQRPYYRHELAG